jgi:hypothetical protein
MRMVFGWLRAWFAVTALILSSLMPSAAFAQTSTPELTTITHISTGWGCDCFGLTVDKPTINPANCPIAGSYVADTTVGGFKTHYAAALAAMSMGRRIMVTVYNDRCIHGRAAILGLSIYPN